MATLSGSRRSSSASMPNNHEIRLMMNDPPWLPLAISFHFLDLPPEIRNLVYYELLTLPEASSVRGCHPQILATSKQMHSEAKKLLFLLNYIPIRILPGGVFIGNLRCGDYAPSLRSNKKGVIPGSSQNDLRHLVWPDFLRTAPFIRFEGGGTVDCSAKTHIDDEWQQAFNRSGSDRLLPYQYEMFISNVLWLLSAELHKERMCRLLKGTWRRHDTFLSHPGYGLELYPSVVNGTQFSYNPRPVDVDMRSMAKDVQAGKTMTIAAVLASCLTLLWRVYAAHPPLGAVTYNNAASDAEHLQRPTVTILGSEIASKKMTAQALFAAVYAKPATTENPPVFRLEFVNCTFLDLETVKRLRELFPRLRHVEIQRCLYFGWHRFTDKDEQLWLEQVRDLPFSLDIAYYEPPRRYGPLQPTPHQNTPNGTMPAHGLQTLSCNGWESNEEKRYGVPRRRKDLKHTPERPREVCSELLAGRGGKAFAFRFRRGIPELVLSGCVSTVLAITNASGYCPPLQTFQNLLPDGSNFRDALQDLQDRQAHSSTARGSAVLPFSEDHLAKRPLSTGNDRKQRERGSPVSDDANEAARICMTQRATKSVQNEVNGVKLKTIHQKTFEIHCNEVKDFTTALKEAKNAQHSTIQTAAISIHEVKDHTSDLRFVKDARDEKLRTAADNQASNERNTACIKVINAETGQTSVDTVKDCTAELSEAVAEQQTKLDLSTAARAKNTCSESEGKAIVTKTASIAVDKVLDLTPQIKDALTPQQSRLDQSVRAIASNARSESEVKAILAQTASIAVDKVKDHPLELSAARESQQTKLQESVDAQVEESRNEMELQAIEASLSGILVDSVKDCKLQIDDAKSKQRERAAQAANNAASNFMSQCRIDAIMQATNTIGLVELKNFNLDEEIETNKMESRARGKARNTATNLAKQSKIAAITAQAKSMVDNADPVKDFTQEMTEAANK
ncbi:uncharacterized protein MYCGRDRAFT_92878 [Zymoseptoria tritici IPO323]|uniref:Uncharacterized protein n=1 Tax=Zymoseptoria tritici (strain CBS 115943 / IPO323) TaxID=336722 RepID=F9X979_ZYMTI|nr:uncharacterized protein MYCGRDRAFT_92878 [Zymoseptoria tritici IPO323]EGP88139.1 hypothetical protein MYCGRDRAFT_92878 [Zymoseptoria tritici IPO323]